MILHNDKEIVISMAGSRKATIWKMQKMMWSDFINKISQPAVSTETLQEYKAMKKAQQDELKDVGGYVGGTLKGNRRKNGCLTGRYLITLDADNIAPGGAGDVVRRVSGLGCASLIYSTRKHEGAAPRLRIVFPTDRVVTADEYEPIARKLASLIGIRMFDPTTFESIRMMYLSSRCVDGEWVFHYEDKPFLSADGILAMYGDWTNVAEWPEVPGTETRIQQGIKKLGDPREKPGIIGAFCRVYDIPEAISEFLSEVYDECGNDRYTYKAGSTSSGAVLYDDGQYLYSNHGTDPARGRSCNSFDLVRIHRFGHLDDDAAENTPVNKLPSFRAMRELAEKDKAVKREHLISMFPEQDDDTAWLDKLELSGNKIAKTAKNIQLILEHDPELKDRFQYDRFSSRIYTMGGVPWNQETKRRDLVDADLAGLRVFLETQYRITGKEKIQDAFETFLQMKAVHVVRDYLNGLRWDGIPRLDQALIDYLGAEDTPYTRAVTRKLFCAGVARVFDPGIKYDYLVVLIGPQGIGKSTFIRIMGVDWYSDSLKITDMKDKTAAEKLQGMWVLELSEMDGFSKTESTVIKSFLAMVEDMFRPAFGKLTVRRPRQCIMVGTSNQRDFLTDETGNRRFWPVDCKITAPQKSVFRELKLEIGQIWAEAVVQWKSGESLYMDAEMEKIAEMQQEEHKQEDPRKGVILEFLKRPIPINWYTLDEDQRRFYDEKIYTGEIMERTVICAAEIWVECFHGRLADMKQRDTRVINAILGSMPGWKPVSVRFGANYGKQRGYERSVPQEV